MATKMSQYMSGPPGRSPKALIPKATSWIPGLPIPGQSATERVPKKFSDQDRSPKKPTTRAKIPRLPIYRPWASERVPKKSSDQDRRLKKPTNRANYEAISVEGELKGGKPADRAGYQIVGGSQRSVRMTVMPMAPIVTDGTVVNRPAYEMVSPASNIATSSQLPNTEAGLKNVHFPKEHVPSILEHPSEVASSGKSTRSSRKSAPGSAAHRRRRKLEEKIEEKRVVRFIVPIGLITLAVIVIGIIIGVTFYFVAEPEKESIPATIQPAPPSVGSMSTAMHFRQAADCSSIFKAPPGCVFGSMPNYQQQCGFGTCRKVEYKLGDGKYGPYFQPMIVVTEGKTRHTNASVFCLPAAGHPISKPRVCVHGQCNHEYIGSKYRYYKDEYKGVWVDNCGEKNASECWTSNTKANITPESIFGSAGKTYWTTRLGCIRTNKTSCPNDDNVTAGLVWLQHLSCELNPSSTGEYCEGLPIRLWECARCLSRERGLEAAERHSRQLCGSSDNAKIISDGCVVECHPKNGPVRYERMPDGASCQNTYPSYCYKGACLVVQECCRYPRKPLDLNRCSMKKKVREKWWNRSSTSQ